MAKPESAPAVTIEWEPVEDLPISMADNLHWRTIADRCYLTIGQMNLPVSEGPVTKIQIRPIARFVVTPQVLHILSKIVAEAAAQFPEAEASESK